MRSTEYSGTSSAGRTLTAMEVAVARYDETVRVSSVLRNLVPEKSSKLDELQDAADEVAQYHRPAAAAIGKPWPTSLLGDVAEVLERFARGEDCRVDALATLDKAIAAVERNDVARSTATAAQVLERILAKHHLDRVNIRTTLSLYDASAASRAFDNARMEVLTEFANRFTPADERVASSTPIGDALVELRELVESARNGGRSGRAVRADIERNRPQIRRVFPRVGDSEREQGAALRRPDIVVERFVVSFVDFVCINYAQILQSTLERSTIDTKAAIEAEVTALRSAPLDKNETALLHALRVDERVAYALRPGAPEVMRDRRHNEVIVGACVLARLRQLKAEEPTLAGWFTPDAIDATRLALTAGPSLDGVQNRVAAAAALVLGVDSNQRVGSVFIDDDVPGLPWVDTSPGLGIVCTA